MRTLRDLRRIKGEGARSPRDLRRIKGEGAGSPRDLRRMGRGQFRIFEIRSDGCGYFAQRPTNGCDWVLGWAVLGTPILVLLLKFDAQIERKKERKNNFERKKEFV